MTTDKLHNFAILSFEAPPPKKNKKLTNFCFWNDPKDGIICKVALIKDEWSASMDSLSALIGKQLLWKTTES